MWFIGVEVEQETSAPPPKKNPGSAPDLKALSKQFSSVLWLTRILTNVRDKIALTSVHLGRMKLV